MTWDWPDTWWPGPPLATPLSGIKASGDWTKLQLRSHLRLNQPNLGILGSPATGKMFWFLTQHQIWHNTRSDTTPGLTQHQVWHNTRSDTTPGLTQHQVWHNTRSDTTPGVTQHQVWMIAANAPDPEMGDIETGRSPLLSGVILILWKSSSTSLHAMELRHHSGKYRIVAKINLLPSSNG